MKETDPGYSQRNRLNAIQHLLKASDEEVEQVLELLAFGNVRPAESSQPDTHSQEVREPIIDYGYGKGDFWDQLSQEEQNGILTGIKDMEEGRHHSAEDAFAKMGYKWD